MFSKKADFYGEISLSNLEAITGFGAIIDETEEHYLKMMLGGRQYSEFLDSIFNEDSADFAKWNDFLYGGFRYDYDGYKISYRGMIKALNYFCFDALISDSTYTAGVDIYTQQVTSGNRLEGLEREKKLNSIYNAGIKHFKKAYSYIANNEDYKFETAYYCEPTKRQSFGGVTL